MAIDCHQWPLMFINARLLSIESSDQAVAGRPPSHPPAQPPACPTSRRRHPLPARAEARPPGNELINGLIY